MYRLERGMAEVLKQTGTVLIPLPPSASDAIAEIFRLAPQFFHAAQDQKRHNVLREECGYRQFGVEYSESPDRPDQIESFTACARVSPESGELPLPSAQVLYHQMTEALRFLEPIAETLTISLAELVSGTAWAEKLKGGLHRWSRLQLNFSRPDLVATANINDPHEDGNLLTLTCATAPGLELQISDGTFTAVPPSSDHLLVLPGEIAWLLSGGAVQPAWHRVIPDPRVPERMALMLFADLNPAMCEPWVQNEINAGVDIGARFFTNDERSGLNALTPE